MVCMAGAAMVSVNSPASWPTSQVDAEGYRQLPRTH